MFSQNVHSSMLLIIFKQLINLGVGVIVFLKQKSIELIHIGMKIPSSISVHSLHLSFARNSVSCKIFIYIEFPITALFPIHKIGQSHKLFHAQVCLYVFQKRIYKRRHGLHSALLLNFLRSGKQKQHLMQRTPIFAACI